MSLDKDDIRQFIQDNLSIELSFESWSWDGSNELTVKLKLDGDVISSDSCTINWRDDSKDDY